MVPILTPLFCGFTMPLRSYPIRTVCINVHCVHLYMQHLHSINMPKEKLYKKLLQMALGTPTHQMIASLLDLLGIQYILFLD